MKHSWKIILLPTFCIIGIYALLYIFSGRQQDIGIITKDETIQKGNMKITSSQFIHEGLIPPIYTCDGQNISPPLSISGVPEGTKSFVLVMDDPDVPESIRPDGIWDHWIVFNIPPETREILKGQSPPGVPGMGTSGKQVYGGPCPPDREHRYFFKLYALDTMLGLSEGVKKSEVERAMAGHIVAEASLMGRYDRKR